MDTFLKKVTFRNGRRPHLLEARSSTWFTIITVSTAIFTDIFLYAVIVPVFPFALVNRMGVHPDDVQHWLAILLSAYGASLLVVAPICGYFSDIIVYRRTPLILGMFAIAGSTLMLCLAKSLPVLVVGRVLQGASAGVIWVVGLALLADTVGKDNAGQAMGYVGMAYSSAALIAPLLGGIVYDRAGYYSVFGMAFGMCALDLTLRLLLIEKKSAVKWLGDSSGPQHAEESNTTEPTKELTRTQTRLDNDDPANINAAENVAAEEAGVTNLQKKRLPPMLLLLKSRRMQAVFWASTVDALMLTAFDTTLPIFVETTFHWNSLGAGLIFLALLSPTFIQPLFGWLVDRYGARYINFVGLVITVVPWICLRFVTHNSMGQKVLLCALLFLIGLGAAISLAATMTEFTIICAEKEEKNPGCMGRGGAYAQSYALFNVSWALGSVVGAYWAGGIRTAAGWGTMCWTIALLAAVVSVPSLLFVDGWIGLEKTKLAARTQRRAQLKEEKRASGSRPCTSQSV